MADIIKDLTEVSDFLCGEDVRDQRLSSIVEDAIELLKNQINYSSCENCAMAIEDRVLVVRCKDCKYWSAERINDFNKCRRWINVGVKNFATIGDWFCADGEPKDGETD